MQQYTVAVDSMKLCYEVTTHILTPDNFIAALGPNIAGGLWTAVLLVMGGLSGCLVQVAPSDRLLCGVLVIGSHMYIPRYRNRKRILH